MEAKNLGILMIIIGIILVIIGISQTIRDPFIALILIIIGIALLYDGFNRFKK
jgi:hypothetical protein